MAACTDRRCAGVAVEYRPDRISGWVNCTRSGVDREQPGRLGRPPARIRRCRGVRTRRRSRPGPRRPRRRPEPPSWPRRRARRRGGRRGPPARPRPGSGHPAAGRRAARWSLVSSWMASGLPPERSRIRRDSWAAADPASPWSTSPRSTSSRVAVASRPVSRSCGRSCATNWQGSPVRAATRTATASASSRRATKAIASWDGRSTRWASSTIMAERLVLALPGEPG